TVAVAARDGRVFVVDVATGGVTTLAASQDGPVTGLAFSPDSAWLAWSHPGTPPLSQIRLARLADAVVVDVTDGRFRDTEPVFSKDGLYLAFLSLRSFDPIYDAHFFDLSFPYGCRPYLVTLAATTPSPFAPQPGGRPVGDDGAKQAACAGEADEEQAAPQPGTGERGAGEQAAGERAAGAERRAGGRRRDLPVVTVDVEGLPSRVVGVPVEESLYSGLRAVAGGLVWLRGKVTGVLGESAADPDDDPPRPALARFA